MIDTEIVQRCGCGEDDCVEILGLEESIYACFTCGYAGVTPSGADNYEDEIHIGNLEAEVTRLREGIEHALHIRLRHGQEEGWRELKGLIE
jgi:hypothetical protein